MKDRLRFKVTGNGYFPVDMLRYDRCFPVNSEDATRIQERCLDFSQTSTVTLESDARIVPTKDRWQSFGWRVTDITKI